MTALQVMWGSIAVNVVLVIGILLMNNKFQQRYDSLRRSYRRSVDAAFRRDQTSRYHLKQQQTQIVALTTKLHQANKRNATQPQKTHKWVDRDPLNMLGYEDTMHSGPL